MKLIHPVSRSLLQQELETKGFYQPEKPVLFTPLNAASWFFEPVKEDMVYLQISTTDSRLQMGPVRHKGLDVYEVFSPLFPGTFCEVLPEDLKRVNILMNTSIIDDAWCYKALKPYLHPEDQVCVLAFSFFDDTKNLEDWNRQYKKGQGIWYRANTDVFRKFGISPKQVTWVNYFTDSQEDMINAITSSNILLLTGGAPDLFMKRIREKKLQKYQKRYKGVILGYSAGAMIQLQDYHILPDQDYPQFSWQSGLGYFNHFDIEVHYAATPHQKQWLEQVASMKDRPIYRIYEEGGLIVEEDQITCFGKVDL